jgi:hypothetical protein
VRIARRRWQLDAPLRAIDERLLLLSSGAAIRLVMLISTGAATVSLDAFCDIFTGYIAAGSAGSGR